MKRILILGGTGDAVELATRASQIAGVEVITSLAGQTRQPLIPQGNVRVGSFGREAGLADYLRTERIDLLIDATHPFAAQISFHAAAAATDCSISRLLLTRPAWQPRESHDAWAHRRDRWIEVPDYETAAATLPGLAKRVFLTTGRQTLAAFAHLKDIWFLMRMIEPPPSDMPTPPGKLLLERGPFSLAGEQELLRTYKIEAIVSKNSGGNATYAKVAAARELGIPVVMVQRPPVPAGEQAIDVESALAWIVSRL
jgi:precorrin-6A/cobalt-precorrin-6A reductase